MQREKLYGWAIWFLVLFLEAFQAKYQGMKTGHKNELIS